LDIANFFTRYFAERRFDGTDNGDTLFMPGHPSTLGEIPALVVAW
jgi:hypothetical protein